MIGQRPKNLRPFGRSAVHLPSLGFGAAALGNLYASLSDETAADTVRAALAAGLCYFDTAPHYGFGLSESRLGATLPADVLLSTKVGRLLVPATDIDTAAERHGFVDAAPFEPVFDYSYDGVMRSFEASLGRLGRDRIDILLAHDLGRETHGADHPTRLKQFLEGGYLAMRALRESGAVGAIGLGVNEVEICQQVLAHAEVDGFLLAGRYTLLEQEALDDLLPSCAARGVSIILGGPFNSGALVEGVRPGRTLHYNYGPAPQRIVERVQRLEAICAAYRVPLAAAALQFPLAHPQVVSVIPGMAGAEQVAQVLAWSQANIPDALWEALRGEGLLRPDAPVPKEPLLL